MLLAKRLDTWVSICPMAVDIYSHSRVVGYAKAYEVMVVNRTMVQSPICTFSRWNIFNVKPAGFHNMDNTSIKVVLKKK